MKEFVESLEAKIKDLTSSIDSDLEQLPPLEQVEAASEVAYGIRSLKGSARWLKDQLTEMLSGLKAEVSAMEASLKEGVMSEIQSGEDWIAKADHEAALELARKEERDKVAAEFQAAKEKEQKAAARNSELLALLPEGVTATFPADLLSLDGDAFTLAKGKISERMAKMKEGGYTSPLVYADVLSIATDEAGDKAFADKLSMWAELAKGSKPDPEGSAPSQSENQSAAPARPPVGQPAPEGAESKPKKKLVLA